MSDAHIEAERAAFEAALKQSTYKEYTLSRFGHGTLIEVSANPPRTYLSVTTESAWALWKAARATPAQATAAPTDLSAAIMALEPTAHYHDEGLKHIYRKGFVAAKEQAARLASLPGVPQAASAEAKRRDVFAICDAYESGIGHGLQLDGHKSGAIFGNPECGKAYEIGYELGEERAREGKTSSTVPQAVAVPEGWVPVPKDLTREMYESTWEIKTYVGFDRARDDYDFMLAAIPHQPSKETP